MKTGAEIGRCVFKELGQRTLLPGAGGRGGCGVGRTPQQSPQKEHSLPSP